MAITALLAQLGRGGLAEAKRAIAKLDAKAAQALLEDARGALGDKPGRPELRELVALALEVATPAAVDLALEWSHIVTLRTKPSARARRALYARMVERLPSMEPTRATRLLSVVAMRTTEYADADEVTLALLRAVVDDGRLANYVRTGAARDLARHAFPDEGAPRAAFVEALAARADLAVVDRRHSVRALLLGDPAQAYEELAPRYREREERPTYIDEDGNEIVYPPHTWRAWIAGNLDAGADARWVNEALRVAAYDAAVAARTLGRVATPRAREELLQWADVPALDDRVMLALRALGVAGDARAAPLVLRWLELPDGDRYAAALIAVLTQVGEVDDVNRIEALIAQRPDHTADLHSALAACRSRPGA
ncbi:MAG: hypothetical protein Q8O67_25820 [Deltaproteobacteria bacterium]|nr:hypothetical protein [Deltaproteobacteria bacterium]